VLAREHQRFRADPAGEDDMRDWCPSKVTSVLARAPARRSGRSDPLGKRDRLVQRGSALGDPIQQAPASRVDAEMGSHDAGEPPLFKAGRRNRPAARGYAGGIRIAPSKRIVSPFM
jgi:hypothetical protein